MGVKNCVLNSFTSHDFISKILTKTNPRKVYISYYMQPDSAGQRKI